MKLQRKIQVQEYTYWKNGRKHVVPAHERTITVDKVKVTKEAYQGKFQKRSHTARNRDRSRTKHNSLVRGSEALLSPNWDTSKVDWMGVDAKGYVPMPSGSDRKEMIAGLPEGYSIVKVSSGKKRPQYRPRFNGKNIGPTQFLTTYNDAKRIVTNHYGRAAGKIRNANLEDEFTHMENNLWKGKHHADELRGDKDLFDKEQLDNNLYYTEKIKDFKSKFNMANQDIWNTM